ncbi:MAG: VWA domain-containing protein [Acidobacteriota bacterium]
MCCVSFGLLFSLPAQGGQNRKRSHSAARNEDIQRTAHRTPAPPVQLCVVVRNERGQAVQNLSKRNFRLWDNGRLQRISDFAADVVPSPVLNLKIPGTVRYTALYFDDLHYNFVDTIRVTDSAYSYFGSTLGPRNKIGVFTSSGDITLNFTDNRKEFHKALLAIRPHLLSAREAKVCPSISDYEAYLLLYAHDPLALKIALEDMNSCKGGEGQADPPVGNLPVGTLRQMKSAVDAQARKVIKESDARAQKTLKGLDSLIGKVAALPDPRAIIVASPGFLTGSLSRQVDLLARRATRLHILVSALNTTGLIRQLSPPPPTANRQLNEEREAIVYAKNQMIADRASMASNVLLDLSTTTGGNFVANMDDLESGFKATVPLPPAYYVLGYYPSDARKNGRFHSVRVRVVRRGLMGVQAPPGYYAPGTASQIARSSIRHRHSKRRRK